MKRWFESRPIMTMVVLVVCAAIVGVSPAVIADPRGDSPSNEQESDQRFKIGVVRADGILLPFANFDGDEWKVSWPADLAGRDLPASLTAISRDWWGGDEPQQWRLFAPDGGAPKPAKITLPIMIRIGMARRLALRTDQPPAPVKVPPVAVAFPKLGLAVAGNVEVKPIPVNIPSDTRAWEFLQSIRSALNTAEERTVNALRANTGWKHPVDKNLRTRLDPMIEAWYSTSAGNGEARASYVEVVKRYPPGPDDEGCGLETFITGWVHQGDRPERPKAELRATIMYCDRDRASYMLPLGQIEVRNRTFWIFQMAGIDHEWYAVAEAERSRVRVVAEYYAGGFSRPGMLVR